MTRLQHGSHCSAVDPSCCPPSLPWPAAAPPWLQPSRPGASTRPSPAPNPPQSWASYRRGLGRRGPCQAGRHPARRHGPARHQCCRSSARRRHAGRRCHGRRRPCWPNKETENGRRSLHKSPRRRRRRMAAVTVRCRCLPGGQPRCGALRLNGRLCLTESARQASPAVNGRPSASLDAPHGRIARRKDAKRVRALGQGPSKRQAPPRFAPQHNRSSSAQDGSPQSQQPVGCVPAATTSSSTSSSAASAHVPTLK
jgi:hypothetical protein